MTTGSIRFSIADLLLLLVGWNNTIAQASYIYYWSDQSKSCHIEKITRISRNILTWNQSLASTILIEMIFW